MKRPLITYQTRRRVNRSAKDAFEVIGTHVLLAHDLAVSHASSNRSCGS